MSTIPLNPVAVLPIPQEPTEASSLQALQLQWLSASGATPAVLLLSSVDGTPRLQVSVQGEELVLDCLSGSIRLRSHGLMQLEAPQLALVASQALSLRSEGDLHVQAEGRLDLQARDMRLQAQQGDIHLIANDDVRLEGERVRTNA